MLHSVTAYLLTLSLSFVLANSTSVQVDKKTAYGILIDNTRSLEKQFPQVLMLGKRVISYAQKRGPISLFNFIPERSEEFVMESEGDIHEGGNYDRAVATLGVKWSQDDNLLSQYIDDLLVVKGETDLFQAIHSMVKEINAKVYAEKDTLGDKVIILITDGDHRMEEIPNMGAEAKDDERRKQQRQLIKEVKESGIKVYALGLVQQLNVHENGWSKLTTRERAESFLNKITKETGGRVVFPKSKKIDVDNLLSELLTK